MYYVYCVCSGLRTRIEFLDHKVVRIIQTGFQPLTVSTPALDSGCPALIIYARLQGIHANDERKYYTQTTLQQI